MTSFKPGDRVTDGKRIGTVVACGITERAEHVVCVEYCLPLRPQFTHESVAKTNLRPAWQECKDCEGDGFAPNACDDCPTCKGTGRINRTGPYRLANGEWSDGVNRSGRIDNYDRGKASPDRWVTAKHPKMWDDAPCWYSMRGPDNSTPKYFDTHAEAIDYAHKKAREVTG